MTSNHVRLGQRKGDMTTRRFLTFYLDVTRKTAIVLMLGMTLYYITMYRNEDETAVEPENGQEIIKTDYYYQQENITDGIHRVLFFSYIRGGSSIGSEIFDLDNRSLLWYEPLDAFYFSTTGYFGRKCQKVYMDEEETILRPLENWEIDRLTEYMINLYDCNILQLPSELKVHRFLMHTSALKLYTSCYERNSADSIIWDLIYCRRMIQNTCGMSVETAIGNQCRDVMDAVHRATNIKLDEFGHNNGDFQLTDDDQKRLISTYLNQSSYNKDRLQTILQDVLQYRSCLDELEEISAQCLQFAVDACPKQTIRAAKIVRSTFQPIASFLERIPGLKVILFVRDPRAVAYSRSSSAKPNDQVLRNYLKLCMKMRADLYYRQEVDRLYPNAVAIVRYEDYVEEPMKWLTYMYTHIGADVPIESATKFIRTHLYAGKDDGLKFGDIRANASKIAYKWVPLIAPDLMFKMQQACPDILTTLGYPFY